LIKKIVTGLFALVGRLSTLKPDCMTSHPRFFPEIEAFGKLGIEV